MGTEKPTVFPKQVLLGFATSMGNPVVFSKQVTQVQVQLLNLDTTYMHTCNSIAGTKQIFRASLISSKHNQIYSS